MNFLKTNFSFWRVIRLNHEQITHDILFNRTTRAIRSLPLFCKERQEQEQCYFIVCTVFCGQHGGERRRLRPGTGRMLTA